MTWPSLSGYKIYNWVDVADKIAYIRITSIHCWVRVSTDVIVILSLFPVHCVAMRSMYAKPHTVDILVGTLSSTLCALVLSAFYFVTHMYQCLDTKHFLYAQKLEWLRKTLLFIKRHQD